MKVVWDALITLATGLATWLAPLDVEQAQKPIAALGTILGAGLVTAAYGLYGKKAVASKVGGWRNVLLYLALCTVCMVVYTAIKRATLTESEPRFWSLAAAVWVLSLLLAALFSLIGMLATEKLHP